LGRFLFTRPKKLSGYKAYLWPSMVNQFPFGLRHSFLTNPVVWKIRNYLFLFFAGICVAGVIGLIQVSLRYDSDDAERWWSYYFFNQLISWGQWIIWIPVIIQITNYLFTTKKEVKAFLLVFLALIFIALMAASVEGLLWHIFFNKNTEWPWSRVWKAVVSNRYGFHFLFGLAVILFIAVRQLIHITKINREIPLVRKQSGGLNGSLIIKHKGRTEFIPLTEISHLSASGSYVEIYTDKGKSVVTGTLKQYEAQLPASEFVRVHRSYIVKVDRVQQLIPMTNEDYKLITSSGHQLRVSRSYKNVIPILKGVQSSTD
jgi:hypothetical protein